MTKLEDLILMNETTINFLKKVGVSCQRNEIIKKIFNDETCFFKMNREDAFIILNDVGVNTNTEEVYSDLISSDVYYNLYKQGKIKEDDPEVIIKYKIYDAENLFINNKDEVSYEEDTNDKCIAVKEETLIKKFFKKIKMFLLKY